MNLDTLFPLGIAHYLIGGLLIGAGVSLLFVANGIVGGASTVFTSTWSFVSRHPFFRQPRFVEARVWRLVYAAGMIAGAFAWVAFSGAPAPPTAVTWWQLLVGGFVLGFGARLSGGCTSGHGICGLASLQLPSLLAVVTFLATSIVVAHLVQRLGGA
jgi:uncharacterized membrane protein YedE/YeeE